MTNKIYLGDGAYAEYDGLDITISTQRFTGLTGIHYIVLRSEELKKLIEFAKEKGLVE